MHLQRWHAGGLAETPKATDPAFTRCQTVIIGSNRLDPQAACAEAQAHGYDTLLLSSSLEGETRHIARMHAAIARERRHTGAPLVPPACVRTDQRRPLERWRMAIRWHGREPWDWCHRPACAGMIPTTFFHALDDLLITGPTGTNVMDMHILLVG